MQERKCIETLWRTNDLGRCLLINMVGSVVDIIVVVRVVCCWLFVVCYCLLFVFRCSLVVVVVVAAAAALLIAASWYLYPAFPVNNSKTL